jgi:hypothetical protein
MIELEIQTLSQTRDGLLIDVGGIVVAAGFTLLRQRLVQDPHGTLLTMVVRGPARRQRALKEALDANERIISFDVAPFVEGEARPHFAASRTFARPPPPPPSPIGEALPAVTASRIDERDSRHEPAAISAVPTVPALPRVPEFEPEPEQGPEPSLDFILSAPPAPPSASAPTAPEPLIEIEPLGPDTEAVEAALPKLTNAYPHVFSRLQTLEESVAAGARESSLRLAGQRIGAWAFERDYAAAGRLGLHEAIENIAVPALGALTEIERKGDQLHIRHSPLCTRDGRSGCGFFGGYLEGLLGPVVAPDGLSVFGLCCRSCGADECVLAISD